MENILFPRGSRMIPNCPVMVFGQVRDAVVAPFDLNWDMFYPQLGFAIPRQYTADLEDFVKEIDHYFPTILGFVNHHYFNSALHIYIDRLNPVSLTYFSEIILISEVPMLVTLSDYTRPLNMAAVMNTSQV